MFLYQIRLKMHQKGLKMDQKGLRIDFKRLTSFFWQRIPFLPNKIGGRAGWFFPTPKGDDVYFWRKHLVDLGVPHFQKISAKQYLTLSPGIALCHIIKGCHFWRGRLLRTKRVPKFCFHKCCDICCYDFCIKYPLMGKYCQRHNRPEGWVHITSSNTNLDQISSSESRPSINFKISIKHQHH